MQTTIKIEELAMFLGGIFAFSFLSYEWWLFLILLFLPDVGMLGYFFGNRSGDIV